MILFFDTETTGLPKNWKAPVTDLDNWPRLVQLAYLVYDFDGNLIHSCNEIIKPDGFLIPTEASNVHGITTETASQRGTDINDVFELFLIHLKRSKIIVAHNMAFDEKIIGSELIRLGYENVIVAKEKICTMLKTVDLCKIEGPYGYKWPKLEELHRYLFNQDFEGAHDALADIQATAKCFWELIKRDKIIVKNKSGVRNKINVSRSVALKFMEEKDENGDNIKSAYFNALIVDLNPIIFSESNNLQVENQYRLAKIESVDLNGNKFTMHNAYIYLNNLRDKVIKGKTYQFTVKRKQDKFGYAVSPFLELSKKHYSDSGTLSPTSPGIEISNNFELIRRQLETEYFMSLSIEPKIPETFYSNFLHYPFLRPPRILWFDGSINQHNNHFGCKDIKDVLKRSSEGFEILNSDIKNGLVKNYTLEVSCNHFKTFLEKYFPKMIFNNVGEYKSESGYPTFYLLPNILLYDKISNIHIAINIDSPYDLVSKKPKKYVKYDAEFEEYTYGGDFQLLDYYRDVNLLFSESFENPNERIFYDKKLYEEYDIDPPADFTYGPFSTHTFWFNIKFSEHQVILYPDECCKFIQEEIYRLTKLKLSYFDFSEINTLKKINMWSKRVAIDLSEINFREKLHKLVSLSYPKDIGLSYQEYKNLYRKNNSDSDWLPF